MKTVEDAVRQEKGVWNDSGFNAMAWVFGDIDYMSLDDCGVLHYSEIGEPNDPASDSWQLVCTREEFEAKAKEMGYGVDDSEDDCLDCEADDHEGHSLDCESTDQETIYKNTKLLLAYLQGQADSGIESAQMALDFYRGLNNKGA